jgi:hypothetical protein
MAWSLLSGTRVPSQPRAVPVLEVVALRLQRRQATDEDRVGVGQALNVVAQ